MNQTKGLILLDRDGTINEMIINQDHGTVDSPLHESQVSIIKNVPGSLKKLNDNGFRLFLVTNQPAAAKGKTTLDNLLKVHKKIIQLAQSEGAIIESSEICYHRDEDNCECRKPKPGLLAQIFSRNPEASIRDSWMVGDGVVDIQAGKTIGVQTAFVGPQKCDYCKVFEVKNLKPDVWKNSLPEFVDWLINKK